MPATARSSRASTARSRPEIRLQADFVGWHAIYVDGYYPGNGHIPEAYYVIDPLGRPWGGYRGEWWPASIVDAFGTAFGGGRIPSAWVYPPGGVPPEVVGPDVVPLPPSGDHGTPTPTPSPGESPSASPSGSPSVGPSPTLSIGDPGDEGPPLTVDPGILAGSTLGDLELSPVLVYCLGSPAPPGCPGGLMGVFELSPLDLPIVPLGPTVSVASVGSAAAANVALRRLHRRATRGTGGCPLLGGDRSAGTGADGVVHLVADRPGAANAASRGWLSRRRRRTTSRPWLVMARRRP